MVYIPIHVLLMTIIGVLGVGTDVNDGVDSHFGQIMRIVGKSVAAAADDDDDDDDDDDVSNVDNDYRGKELK